jgi:hypothetical protein
MVVSSFAGNAMAATPASWAALNNELDQFVRSEAAIKAYTGPSGTGASAWFIDADASGSTWTGSAALSASELQRIVSAGSEVAARNEIFLMWGWSTSPAGGFGQFNDAYYAANAAYRRLMNIASDPQTIVASRLNGYVLVGADGVNYTGAGANTYVEGIIDHGTSIQRKAVRDNLSAFLGPITSIVNQLPNKAITDAKSSLLYSVLVDQLARLNALVGDTAGEDDEGTGPVAAPAATVPRLASEFKAVAGRLSTFGFNDISVLLYLEDIYSRLGPANQYLVNSSPEYSRFRAATEEAGRRNHTAQAQNGVTVSVPGLPWNVAIDAGSLWSGTIYSNSVAAAGSRTPIAVVNLTLYTSHLDATSLYPTTVLSNQLGILGLSWQLWTSSVLPVRWQPYNNVNYVGFFTVSVTVSGLAKYKDYLVLDGEYWGYAPIRTVTQTGETITFQTNHTGVFSIFGVKSSDNPQTADNSNIALYSMLALVSLAGIAIVNRKRAFNS